MVELEKTLEKPSSEASQNSCRALVLCQDPEPLHLIYLRKRWLEENSAFLARSPGSESGSEESGSENDENVNPLLLDPTQWKDQDHYAILGLGKLRYRATEQDIKKAYRQKVLTHHPDKQTEEQQKEGDDHFKCIKIAYDILWNPKKRRAYDSVDPTFDDTIPTASTASKENFYTTFAPVFDENARWSVKKPVPRLGDENSSISEVDTFYSFWYSFESWREYSYQDEENPEKGECREERRWIEKQNKVVRQKKKKEEMARLRTLVDTAYSCDPRVKRFKESEKAEKEAKKKARAEAARKEACQRREEERRRQEEELARKEREEEEARATATQAKKEREAAKKALRKERKNFRAACKEHNYFSSGSDEMVSRMQDLDRLCTSLSHEDLQRLNQEMTSATPQQAKALFEAQVAELNRRDQEQLQASLTPSSSSDSLPSATPLTAGKSSHWSHEEVQLLVKAVNLFPAGTVRRWETVAGFINTHATPTEDRKEKDPKMVIAKVKALQKLEADQKESLNKQAFSRFEQQHLPKEKTKAATEEHATPSERYDDPKPWTAAEQKLLEQALRTHPSSLGAGRWDKIASAVGSRTKDECVARFKELVARVKAKKQSS